MPRAIAPLVTTIGSPPWAGGAASDSHTPRSTSTRGSPSLPATTLEPSLKTTRVMRGAYLPSPRTLARRRALRRRVGVELEHRAGDLDLVARLKPLGLERLEHAD